jgi:hypothetical protein
MPFIEKANQPVVWRSGDSFVKVTTASRADGPGSIALSYFEVIVKQLLQYMEALRSADFDQPLIYQLRQELEYIPLDHSGRSFVAIAEFLHQVRYPDR